MTQTQDPRPVPTDGAVVSPTVRRVWIVLGSLAAVAALGLGTVEALSWVAHEDRTEQRSFDPSGVSTIEISSDDGSVVVVGDSETSIRVTIRISQGLGAARTSADLRGDRLVLAGSCPWFASGQCSVSYEVHAPAGLAVVAHTDNGDIETRDVRGDAELISDNGDVLVQGLGGTVRLESDNGDIDGDGLVASSVRAASDNGDVTIAFTEAPSQVTATSSNGDVVVVLPAGEESYALDAATDNGDASTPIRTDPASTRRVTARSDNGDVTVRYPER